MSEAAHRPAFYLAVVGDAGYPADRVTSAVERLTRGVRNRCRLVVLTPGGGPVVDWCRRTNVSAELAPYLPELYGRFAPARLAMRLTSTAHGVLIFGDPRDWPLLVQLASLAGIPWRVVRRPAAG